MKTSARLQVLVGFFLTISVIVTYRVVRPDPVNYDLQQTEIAYQRDKIDLKRRNLERNSDLLFYGVAVLLSSACLSALILSSAWHRAHVKRAKVHCYKIDNSEIIVHERDLSMAWQICTGLVNAQALERSNAGMQKAFELYTTMADIQNAQLRALVSRRGLHAPALNAAPVELQPSLPTQATPTFAELYHAGEISEGKPLYFGLTPEGVPQYRHVEDIKALSVAGWQGSGKTLSTAYLVSSLLIIHPSAHAYVIDPHANHTEGLGAFLKPLEHTGRLQMVNPLDTPELMSRLNRILDDRLSGRASSDQLIILVIDEMARIGKTDTFSKIIVPFIERCTEETRKANIIFVGCSQKWQARFFGGHADIRQTIPSLLVHKTKPSQAALLLEDNEEKKLVKRLSHAGEALLSTSHDADPSVVRMPLITKADIYAVSQRLVANGPPVSMDANPLANVSDISAGVSGPANPLLTPDKQGDSDPVSKLLAMIQSGDITQTKAAKEIGINNGYLGQVLKGYPISERYAMKISAWLRQRDKRGEVIQFPQNH